MDSDGLIKVASADEARFDHKYEDGNIVSLGLLVEEDRSNLITYSEDFSTTSTWTRNNYDVSTNVITAPDGTLTADKIIPINSDTFHDVYKSPTLSSGTYTFSIFAKAEEQSFIRLRIDTSTLSRIAVFNISNGTLITDVNITSSSIIPYPNGWYRCSITITDNITNVVINGFPTSSTGNYSGDGTSGLYIWGAQLEEGAFPTSYIPRPGTSTATREPDNASMTGDNFSDWYNQSEGTIFSTFKCDNWVTGSSNWFKVFAIYENLGSGVQNNGFWIGNDSNVSNSVRYRVRASGTNQFGPENLTRTTTNIKASMAVKSSDFAITINGNTPTTSSSGILTSTMDSMTIGQDILDLGYHLNGHISQFTYYPTRLTNAQLQTLTK